MDQGRRASAGALLCLMNTMDYINRQVDSNNDLAGSWKRVCLRLGVGHQGPIRHGSPILRGLVRE